ncbi:MAG: MBL fold metallo-hydrolase [Candidatus Heimdallarchaeota archaeon]|nr:MBL fold metallo-hydrolase [Candidatus Heimdallarchaeota archaeon]
MKVYPIACESLGTRSFSHIVVTDDVVIMIDPSVSLAPTRFGLPPHPLEIAASWKSRRTILDLIDKVDVIIQTHYHADHYTMGFQRNYEFTNRKTFEVIYSQDKIILAKDHKHHLNFNQQKRAKWLWKKKNLDIKIADSSEYEFGDTKITFSDPVFHGIDSKRGCVVETFIEDCKSSYLYSSDVCGPATKEATDFVLEKSPDTVILDGPTVYHPNVTQEEKEVAFSNLKLIVDNIPNVYIDHHFLRIKNWSEILKEKIGKVLPSFSQLNNQKPFLLEAIRKELHQLHPVNEKFYTNFNNGIYSREKFNQLLKDFNYYKYWLILRSDVELMIERRI